ncbi:hypothetical protein GOP47_0014350 [Adiantum capillus-veneris]|uniref:Uncharacterized protein n=1 Tax=Adiantum capillus-veneris TaxID=13818 RepID=A0A9D4ULL4_ADICA|nr:hypothetical protein GOP47_0014350 [Adiantum capillus-veneris]
MQALKIGISVTTLVTTGGAFSYRRRKEQKRIWTGARIDPSLTFSLGDHFRGPGCSFIGGGAFTELGPFFLQTDGRGHYVPQLASVVLAYKGSDGYKFNLKGIAVRTSKKMHLAL